MWFSDLNLILPDRVLTSASIKIDNGVIAEISDSVVPGGVPCAGREMFAGFIDMHGDMIEIEMEPRPQVDFPIEVALPHLDARLAATGVTTAYAAVSFSRSSVTGQTQTRTYEHTSKVISDLHAKRGACVVDHRIHARFDITFDNAVGVLRELVEAGKVDLVSLMDHTPGQGQYRDIEKFIRGKAKNQGISTTEARQMVTTRIAQGTRPQEVILGNIRAVSDLCSGHGVALASHDDDTSSKARLMAEMGAVISEFPVSLEAAETAVAKGMMTAMGAPNAMRGQSYSGNLSAREAHAKGLLSILAADYHPGAILPAIRILAQTDPNGLPGAAALATVNPAAALGLTDRGALVVGKRADLALVDPGLNRIDASFVAGRTAFSNGTVQMIPARQRAVA